MADKRYIDADKLTFSRVRIIHSDGTIGGWHAVVMSSVIKDAPAADVVSKGVYEQVQWERDMAMQQLDEHGIPFGGTADDVVNVVRCKDCKYTEMIVDIIGNPQLYCRHHRYYPNVDFDDFCSWGKRKEKDDGR